ncbi:WD40-repeat-containing domain protein [Radiomyces spectabilis]|uniref:WD40-repeat-containing domain protein n=1 Tax=Radiomyces spectabilis TaxID=64574 RepID=UPI00221F7618|nr:WD40-repeat-containing domain protein [Radiomyces spectabilis]KAI8369436.1 WD40-repeat-containing domain protein [Radiomyces spectabilis]
MGSITKFDTAHEDLIHNVAYDFYGKRLVTCSSDQRLKVWDFVERDESSAWELNDSWKAHDASILKAIWAHPEYGQVIASCSFDCTVKIWEEQISEPKMSQKRWFERGRLSESSGVVLDIAFAPMQGALRLASCSADGIVRIYEAPEPTDLSQWSEVEEFEISTAQYGAMDASKVPSSQGFGSTAQQQQQQHQALSYQQQQQKQSPYPYQALPPHHLTSTSQQQQALSSQSSHHPYLPQHPSSMQPANNHSTSSSNSSVASHTATGAGSDGGMFGSRMTNAGGMGGYSGAVVPVNQGQGVSPGSSMIPNPGLSQLQSGSGVTGAVSNVSSSYHRTMDINSGYCIDWCPNRTATAMMVVGLGKEIGARIFKHDGHNRWYPAEFLPGHTQEVHDVSWAPSMARSYQLIATACKDHYVRIYKLTEQPLAGTPNVGTSGSSRSGSNRQGGGLGSSSRLGHRPIHVELIASFNDHNAEVWHVEWNVTGTILSSSGDDGKLRLWKAGYDGEWRCMAVITGNQQQNAPTHSIGI